MAAVFGESITVLNKSGKVVSTSKHLVNVFKEARSAYLERKAELKAERDDDLHRKSSKKAIESGRRSPGSVRRPSSHRNEPRSIASRDSSHSRHGSSSGKHRDSRHRDSRHHDPSRTERKSSIQRGYTDSFYSNDSPHPTSPRRTSTQPITPSHLRQSHGPEDYSAFSSADHMHRQLARRHSDTETQSLQDYPSRHRSPGSSGDEYDMDLAYGDLPPPLPIRPEEELRTKMTTLTRLLQEANCVEHSLRAVIKNLEENPDAMAAVALTLAEISNLAARMAPGALTAMKGSFPVVVALLASPEFLIGGGVALGVTIVMFGGYKIIKRIKAKKDLDKDGELELEEITSEVDRIDNWRRGIRLEDADTMSIATSVEGEYITPKASMQLRDEGVLAEKKDKGSSSKKDKSSKSATKEEKKQEKERTEKDKKEKSEREKREKREKKDKDKDKDKEHSGLLMLFKKDKEQILA